MQIFSVILLVMAAVVAALYLGVILPLRLPEIAPILDRKPFNCRPCTTFHLTWMLIGIGAWLTGSICLFVAGVAIAFVVFGIVHHTENKKITK